MKRDHIRKEKRMDISSLLSLVTLTNILDILVVWFLIYRLLRFMNGTRSSYLIRGVVVIAIVKVLSFTLRLNTLDWIMNQVIQWGIIAAVVVFQPEIRKGLEYLGQSNLFRKQSHRTENRSIRMIEELNESIQYMAKRRIGALICIEQTQSLQEYIQTGIALNAYLTNQLITNTFTPNTPLHDGAMIIREYKIAASACYLPLSENDRIPKELGTRHRAAIGLSEVSDAITIVISEETGEVSIAYRNRFERALNEADLMDTLKLLLYRSEVEKTSFMKYVIDIFKGGSSNDKE